jgi:sugar lactone lactonase YvrE
MRVEELSSVLVHDAKAIIGEGPVWDAPQKRWLWVDLPSATVFEGTLAGGAPGKWIPARSWNVGAPACIAVPRKSGGMIVAAGTRIVALNESGATSTLCSVNMRSADDRFNDGKCDPLGRLWIGTLSMSAQPDAALYRLDTDGSLHKVIDGLRLSNGLDWSPDGKRMYHIDSLDLGIDVYDFDMSAGAMSNRRRFVTLERGVGVPDGMCLDEEGHIWLAVFMGGEVRRYAPDGKLVARVAVDARQVTSCAFGGQNRDELLITSARTPLPEWLLRAAGLSLASVQVAMGLPGAGGIFSCRPNVRGPLATAFGG